MYEMTVKPPCFGMLKAGIKTIELRLYDEKRKQINIGDVIHFTNTENLADSFKVEVVALYCAADFEQLCEIISPSCAGFPDKESLIHTLLQFYPLEQQKQYGVVGIEVSRL